MRTSGNPSFSIVIPTYNGGRVWKECLAALSTQTLQPREILVIDSSSQDDTVAVAKKYGHRVVSIPTSEFNHGGTRNRALDWIKESDIVVFLTQDAVLEGNRSVENLIGAFDDPAVGAAFGRQLPRKGAQPIEAHARLYNYRVDSYVVGREDIPRLGLKTVFISNSFAAYRVQALRGVGGFPKNTIFAEDMYATARMVLSGWKVAYASEAKVYHSHEYTVAQEFRRYFDIGVFHARAPWIQREFSGAGGEGLKFVISELRYLGGRAPWRIPEALVRTAAKLVGYKMGKRERSIPLAAKKRLSMHHRFWNTPSRSGTDGADGGAG